MGVKQRMNMAFIHRASLHECMHVSGAKEGERRCLRRLQAIVEGLRNSLDTLGAGEGADTGVHSERSGRRARGHGECRMWTDKRKDKV